MPLLNQHKKSMRNLWFNKYLLRFSVCRNYSKLEVSASDKGQYISLFSKQCFDSIVLCNFIKKKEWESQRVKFASPWILISAGMILQSCSSFTTEQSWPSALKNIIPRSISQMSLLPIDLSSAVSYFTLHHLCYSIHILLNLCTYRNACIHRNECILLVLLIQSSGFHQ